MSWEHLNINSMYEARIFVIATLKTSEDKIILAFIVLNNHGTSL